jgi:UDP-N-acetylglucosamine 3-dehydrogenase
VDYRVAIIGCGGAGRFHGRAYRRLPATELVGACDPDQEARARYARELGVDAVFADPEEMLDAVNPDVVSICTPNPTHAPLTILCAHHRVRGIVCEKPLAMALPEADAMLRSCAANGVRLIVNHQRRFERCFITAKELLDGGAIGRLLRMEAAIGEWDLMSWGTHWLDIFRFYNDDQPTEWVFGQVATDAPKHYFGHPVERAGLAVLRYANGVQAVYRGGDAAEGMSNRLFGAQGVIEVEPCRPPDIGGPIRLLNAESSGWRIIEAPQEDSTAEPLERALAAFLECLETGAPHPLDAAGAREVLAQIIAIYESSRSRRVIPFPVDTQDNPFIAMVERGRP